MAKQIDVKAEAAKKRNAARTAAWREAQKAKRASVESAPVQAAPVPVAPPAVGEPRPGVQRVAFPPGISVSIDGVVVRSDPQGNLLVDFPEGTDGVRVFSRRAVVS